MRAIGGRMGASPMVKVGGCFAATVSPFAVPVVLHSLICLFVFVCLCVCVCVRLCVCVGCLFL